MRFTASSLALLGALLPAALADVDITSPTDSTSWKGAQTVTISWKDSGDKPALSDFTTFNLFLCAGSNADPQCNTALGPASQIFPQAATSTQVQIPIAAGGNGNKVYFIKFESTAKEGGTTTNYSPRFSLSGMTGTFTAAELAGQKKGDKSPPSSVNTVAQVADAADDAADEISVTYTLQTGPTRYAPMQTQPGTTITAKSARMQYPTSSYSVFKSGSFPQPDISTTITASWTYTRTSKVNTPVPSEDGSSTAIQKRGNDMHRFMARWKD